MNRSSGIFRAWRLVLVLSLLATSTAAGYAQQEQRLSPLTYHL